MGKPKFLDDAAFRYLRLGEIDKFHQAIESRQQVDFSGADLRGVDFRNVKVDKLILRDSYLRDADLRGCDLRGVDMNGASIHNAKISGTYFPYALAPAEIQLSLAYGTRLRVAPAGGSVTP
jgi:uncharacterized protein YjbI with pentapeptide repeats